MSITTGTIWAVNGNMVTATTDGAVSQNEVAYIHVDGVKLMAEVLRVRGRQADMQVFEDTTGLAIGDSVEFAGEMLSSELGPGLLSQIYDGLQNPLPKVAEKCGFFLQRGVRIPSLDRERLWDFHPSVKAGDRVLEGDEVGWVQEGIFRHSIMVPFAWNGEWTVEDLAREGSYPITHTVAKLRGASGEVRDMTMSQRWPVKVPMKCFVERLKPGTTMVTKIRLIDTFFPVSLGGTYCIPGPFGAGKTVLQQITSRHAEVDIVVIAACGERAGEVVETLREFPQLTDPRTGRSLMERTVIICNTSSMPVAAREASVYTAVTIASYYRQMGLNVLLLADSTSRWAQALRETSGRLEEIPGEEAFPAYLESVIAAFYERGGIVRLRNGRTGSVTIGGTVSPAGGNFDEPVTQSTLKVVGAFHGLSWARSDRRRYPAIDPLESWSKYPSVVDESMLEDAKTILRKGADVAQMMKVVGEEGTSMNDFLAYLKAEYLDAVYLQQDAYDPVDGATSAERQRRVFEVLSKILKTEMHFSDKDAARRFFHSLTQVTKDWNRVEMDQPGFIELQRKLEAMAKEASGRA